MRIAITGAATGIGAATVDRLKADGHHITAFDIQEPTNAVDHWIKVDMSDASSIAEAVSQIKTPFNGLINNAGVPPKAGMEALTLNINYFGLRSFLVAMLDHLQPGSAIVNTASRAGAMWRNNLELVNALSLLKDSSELDDFVATYQINHVTAYNLSKEAVIVLSLTMFEQLHAKDIRMNSVSPAAVSTGILDDFVAAFGDKVAKNIERVGRAGLPTEVAEVIAFLVSPASHWIKGVDVPIDGGMGALAQCEALQLVKPTTT